MNEEEIRADVEEGLRQSARGEVYDLGSFEQYAHVEALIAEARKVVDLTGLRQSTMLIERLADALEAEHKRADEAIREMHARELHHFEEEQKSATLEAELRKERRMRRMDTGHIGYLEAELRNVSDIGDGDVQRLAESYSENLRLEAELRKERERADGEAHDARHLRSVRDGLKADLARAQEAIKRALDVQMFRVGTVSYGEEYMKKVHSVLREGLARNRN